MKICPICKKNTVSGRNRVCDSPICREEMRKEWHDTSLAVPEGFLEANEYAKKKGISRQAVTKNCRTGKYQDAFQDPKSGRWYVPIDGTKIAGFVEAADRRRTRPLKATDDEWKKIVEAAAMTKCSVNEFILKKAMDKKIT
jgi:hypothetical protein